VGGGGSRFYVVWGTHPHASSDEACQPVFDITMLSVTSEVTLLFVQLSSNGGSCLASNLPEHIMASDNSQEQF
jgi:hypothetical protein